MAMLPTQLIACNVLCLVQGMDREKNDLTSPTNLDSELVTIEKKPVSTSYDRVDALKELEKPYLSDVS